MRNSLALSKGKCEETPCHTNTLILLVLKYIKHLIRYSKQDRNGQNKNRRKSTEKTKEKFLARTP
jgi:hypothetical protein